MESIEGFCMENDGVDDLIPISPRRIVASGCLDGNDPVLYFLEKRSVLSCSGLDFFCSDTSAGQFG